MNYDIDILDCIWEGKVASLKIIFSRRVFPERELTHYIKQAAEYNIDSFRYMFDKFNDGLFNTEDKKLVFVCFLMKFGHLYAAQYINDNYPKYKKHIKWYLDDMKDNPKLDLYKDVFGIKAYTSSSDLADSIERYFSF